MRADGATPDGSFSRGLLNPDAPVPSAVKGQTPKRYAVYRNNVTVSLIRAMEANFPAVRRLLGETYFAGLAREFVQAHPPQSPLLYFYGDAFSGYLAAQDDLAEFPYLADVAKLEQQWRVSYHEADESVLATVDLTGLDPDVLMNSILVPHPAMAVLKSQYALCDIFRANRGGEPIPFDPAVVQDVIVTRPGMEVLVQLLPPGGAVFFAALARGECLGGAAEEAAIKFPDFDLTLNIALLLQCGAFTKIRIPEE